MELLTCKLTLVLGGSSARDFNIKFDANGAAIVSDNPTEMDCGEGVDTADLELGGVQLELAREILTIGIPVIAVLIQGRPHAIPWISENCDAVLCGWYPGHEGGRAIADILFGNANPSGKLAVTIPRASAQLPVYYNHKDLGKDISYRDMMSDPLYPFGFGLSYTKYEYSNIRLENDCISVQELENNHVHLSVEVKNSGTVAGAETVQLYIKGLESSITRRIKELKGFKKVWLEAGESKTVKLKLGKDDFAIWNNNMKFVVEPGHIRIMVGGSSEEYLEALLTIL